MVSDLTSPRRHYHCLETRAGKCLLSYTLQPFSVLRIFLPGTLSETALSLADCDCARISPLARLCRFMEDYFAGENRPPPPLDDFLLDPLTAKEQALLQVVAAIPYGQTRSYQAVAEAAGFFRGARFAGNALAKNPFPVVIPCHRVVRSDGRPGGFGGGPQMKAAMLQMEQLNSGRT